ncbi:MAG: AAA family ATPase [Tepidisphaeraceae bacterium]
MSNASPELSPDDDLAAARRFGSVFGEIKSQIARAVVGQERVIDELLLAVFSGGHCLLQGVPGLAKTMLVRTLADAVDLSFSRVQFTPDLMPSDVTGTDILQDDPETNRRRFEFLPGPVFTNILLADEINLRRPKHRRRSCRRCRKSRSRTAEKRSICRARFSCSPRRTRSNRKGPTRCPRCSWTVSCSWCWSITRRVRKNWKSTSGAPSPSRCRSSR